MSFYFFYPKHLQINTLQISKSHSVVSDSLPLHGLYSPWNSSGQNPGVGSLSLLQDSGQPRDGTQVYHIAGRFFTSWATREDQEYWSGSPIPSPVNLPNPGTEPGSPALQQILYQLSYQGSPNMYINQIRSNLITRMVGQKFSEQWIPFWLKEILKLLNNQSYCQSEYCWS